MPDWLIAHPIAHRGLHDRSGGVVENTLAAAEAAIHGGFAVECDAQMSADGEVFVFHDDALERLTNATGRIGETSAAEIRRMRLVRERDNHESSLRPSVRKRGPGGGGGAAARVGATFALAELSRCNTIPALSDLLAFVAGRTPIICELKSRFDGDWRIGERAVAIAQAYAGPLAFKSFDPDLVAYLRLRFPRLREPLGVVAEAAYDGPDWAFLNCSQRAACESFEHRARSAPDFLSWRLDDLPHRTPFFEKELHGVPIMTWTVRSDADRSAARKWADQIIFEGEGRP